MTKNDPHYAPEPVEHIDQWHRHTPDEGQPQDEHAPAANPVILAGLGVVLTVSFVALLIVVVMYYFNYTTKIRREKMENTSPAAESYAYRNDALDQMRSNGYAWVDVAQGESVQIPFDHAVDQVVSRYGQGR